MNVQDADSRVKFILQKLNEISLTIQKYYQNSKLETSIKDHGGNISSWLTEVDLSVEKFLREEIAKKYPGEEISGEEFGLSTQSSNDHYEWIIDPIDGTESLVYGMPLFGSMVAVLKDKQPVLGVINFPALNEQVYAIKGQGTFWKPAFLNEFEKVRVSKKAPSEGLFVHTGKNLFQIYEREEEFLAIDKKFKMSRSWGDCYGHIMVATGRAEMAGDPVLEPWDIAPIKIIIEEAGGHFLSWENTSDLNAGSGFSMNEEVFKDFNSRMLNFKK